MIPLKPTVHYVGFPPCFHCSGGVTGLGKHSEEQFYKPVALKVMAVEEPLLITLATQGACAQAEGGRPEPHGDHERLAHRGRPGAGGRRAHAQVRRRAAARAARAAGRRVVVAKARGENNLKLPL